MTFTKGHTKSKGKGRPTKAKETKYLEAFKKGLPITRMTAVTKRLVDIVEKGEDRDSIKAAELLIRYAIGKPKEYDAEALTLDAGKGGGKHEIVFRVATTEDVEPDEADEDYDE